VTNPSPKRATAQDVANLAGVSTATVSHVINGTRAVASDTRERILIAIDKLNYVPSTLARGLARQKSGLVGVILSDINNPLFRQVYKSIESELTVAGYDLILANSDENIKTQKSILQALLSRQVDGLIIAPDVGNIDDQKTLLNIDIPVVIIDRSSGFGVFPEITVNNEEVTHAAISHLIEDGHQRIGFIGGVTEITAVSDRLKGYERALREHSLLVDKELIYTQGKAIPEDGYNAATKMLTSSNPPSAFFTSNSLTLIGVFQALNQLSLKCPDDIGIVCFDHDQWMDVFDPPITAIKQPTSELGKLAARWLKKLIDGKADDKAMKQVLSCEFSIRGSCSVACKHKYHTEVYRLE